MQPRTTARGSLTALLGTPVTDSQGHLRGRLKDIAVATGPDAGKVAGLVLKTRAGLAIVPSQDVMETPAGTLELRSSGALVPLQDQGNYLYLQQDLVALCTRPPIPPRVAAAQREVALLEARVASVTALMAITKAFTKLKKSGPSETEKLLSALRLAAKKHVPNGTSETDLPAELKKARDAATAKVLDKPVALTPYTTAQNQEFQSEEAALATALSASLIERYASLATLKSVQAVLNRAQFLGIGLKLAEADLTTCPFCAQPITSGVLAHIQQNHEQALAEQRGQAELVAQRTALQETVTELRENLKDYYERQIQPISSFIEAGSVLPQVEQILSPKHLILRQRGHLLFLLYRKF